MNKNQQHQILQAKNASNLPTLGRPPNRPNAKSKLERQRERRQRAKERRNQLFKKNRFLNDNNSTDQVVSLPVAGALANMEEAAIVGPSNVNNSSTSSDMNNHNELVQDIDSINDEILLRYSNYHCHRGAREAFKKFTDNPFGYACSSSKKRSRRVLSLKERIEVIKIAETRRDTRELALKFECGRTQILSILSQKERLLKEWANNGDPNRLRRRPSAVALTTNKVIYEWLYRCKCAQLPLTDIDILEKAYEAKHLFKYNEFKPNRRWLDRFKRKFRISHEELLRPDPNFFDGVERSLELREIYEEIKHTIELSGSEEQLQMSSMDQPTERLSFENMMNYDQTMSSSNNEVSEIKDSDDEDQSCTPQNLCGAQFFGTEEPAITTNNEDNNKSITNDEQALACLKKLEEYSMLKDNFRAIGLIGQLEKIYKGLQQS